MTLEQDLALWEAGELDRAELAARHPDADVESLLSLFDQLWKAGSTDVVSGAEGWASLRARLPERVATDRPPQRVTSRPGLRAGRLLRRPLMAAVAVVVLSGAAAFAASPSVRTQVGHVVHRLTHLGSPSAHQPRPHGAGIISPSPSGGGVVAGPAPSPSVKPDTGGTGGHAGEGSSGGGGSGSNGGGSSEGSGSGGSGGSGGDPSGSGGDPGGSGGSGGDPSGSGDGSGSGGQPGSGSGDSQGN